MLFWVTLSAVLRPSLLGFLVLSQILVDAFCRHAALTSATIYNNVVILCVDLEL